MKKEEKFLNYLEQLKNVGNADLMESVITGFKTLVEYQVNGNIAERQVDIMESEMVDDIKAEDPECAEDNEAMMEVGEGVLKQKITPKLLDMIKFELSRREKQLEKELDKPGLRDLKDKHLRSMRPVLYKKVLNQFSLTPDDIPKEFKPAFESVNLSESESSLVNHLVESIFK